MRLRLVFLTILVAFVFAPAYMPTADSAALAAPKKANKAKKGSLNFGKGDWRKAAHPLFAAAHDGDLRAVIALIRKDSKAVAARMGGKYRDAHKVTGLIGGTPLTFAAYQGQDRVVPVLLRAGADPDVKDKAGMTPLLWAARYNFHKVVVQLVDGGADVNQKDKSGKRPIDLTIDEKIEAYLSDAAGKDS